MSKLIWLFLMKTVMTTHASEIDMNLTIQPPIYKTSHTVDDFLYPPLSPNQEGYLQVSQRHHIWYAEYGNPEGKPVIFVHGGPGFGCSANDMRYFDQAFYRIILFDQRGALRSTPLGEMTDNTTAHSIEDMETIRRHLKIDKWLVFGGSWGSTLSLAYGENHPDRCLGFILRGIFLGTAHEFHRLWYDMRDHYPKAWQEMVHFLPEEERQDIICSYYERLMNPDPSIHMPAAKAFMKYDLTCAFLLPRPVEESLKNEKMVLGTARIFTHYGLNNFYMEDGQLLKDLSKISHLPAIIVHGQFDTICLIKQAYELHQNWPQSELVIVPDAGHSATEIGTTKALVEATNRMKEKLI